MQGKFTKRFPADYCSRNHTLDMISVNILQLIIRALFNLHPFSKLLNVYIRITTDREKGMTMSHKQAIAAMKRYT
jgi:hypothetical protein